MARKATAEVVEEFPVSQEVFVEALESVKDNLPQMIEKLSDKQRKEFEEKLNIRRSSILDVIPGVAAIRHKNLWIGVSQLLSLGLGVGAGVYGTKRWGGE